MDKATGATQEISLERLKQGDRAEFGRMVEQTSPAIYRLALRILGDSHEAEDALQETYIKALKALPEFEGRSSLSTWLHRIAVNEALMILRKRRPDLGIADEPEEDEPDQPAGLQIVDWCCLPESEMMSAETRRFVNQAIANLPGKLRQVLILRDIEGLSIRETAEALGITEMNVKTRLLRARLRMREELSGYFGERLQEGLTE